MRDASFRFVQCHVDMSSFYTRGSVLAGGTAGKRPVTSRVDLLCKMMSILMSPTPTGVTEFLSVENKSCFEIKS